MGNLAFRDNLPQKNQYTGRPRVMTRQQAKELKEKWNKRIEQVAAKPVTPP